MKEKKRVDYVIDGLTNIANTLRDGYKGLTELIKTHFFLVRDIYNNLLIPRINEVQTSYSEVYTSTPIKVEFETAPDGLLISTTTDIYIDTSETMNRRMYVPAGIHSIKWRYKTWYIVAVNTAGTVYVWGGF